MRTVRSFSVRLRMEKEAERSRESEEENSRIPSGETSRGETPLPTRKTGEL